MEKDWRIVNQEAYLKGKHIVRCAFSEPASSDHAHCAFCWEKFGKEEDMAQVGYRTVDGPWWICERCFEDFKERFEWIV